jgi:hypothetical protein
MKMKFLTLFLSSISLVGLEASPTATGSATTAFLSESSRDSLKDSVSKQFSVFVQGSQEMMEQYNGFVLALEDAVKDNKGLREADMERILDSLTFAAKCHQHQTRKNAKKTPYITHPLTVAEKILTLGKVYDADVIIAALLLDTIDDTHATFQDVRNRFGDKVEGYVRELTQDKSLSTVKRKKLQIIQASSKSKGAATIKLSEKLYNLNNLLQDPPSDWTRERIDQYFQWAQSVVDNLPEANKPLKDEVHRVIQEYWKKQA